MKGKEKHFPQFQGQDKALPDAEITSIWTTLMTWNPYLTVFITILQMIKIHTIIYTYFEDDQKEISLKNRS